ncbi:hypothetical protein B9G69_010705 [Bdellovibrio sp. SKB1291214]|uniref:hypothetical protein n=1 Tax=Bdellovibrio sp. SKB1291214 TaxID=1732569 RepID=UPI000B515BBE|nr:hypothetical protein [Bdellovibrio sp. SKB1291214]UYL07514.1 hypothetical protein B9G69_010705 [Bdellovibrio sp. SKB1291214]
MKLVIAIMALLIGSQSAMAAHLYADDDCIAYTLNNSEIKISIANSRPANPHVLKFEMKDPNKMPFVNFIGATMGNDGDGSDTILTLKTLSSKITQKSSYNEDGWEGWVELSVRVAKVTAVNAEVREQLGLVPGQKLTFICRTSFDAPNGK